jgi:hypothetical protein
VINLPQNYFHHPVPWLRQTPLPSNVAFPMLTSFAKQPTHAILQLLQRELDVKSTSVHSQVGGSRHDHLNLTVTPGQYLQIPGTTKAFPSSAVPPTTADSFILTSAISAAINHTGHKRNGQLHIFHRYHN